MVLFWVLGFGVPGSGFSVGAGFGTLNQNRGTLNR